MVFMIDEEYNQLIERRKECAKIIWDNPFMSGLTKLKKADLLDIIDLYARALGASENEYYYEEDIKDICWEEKCRLIELLDEKFFDKENTKNE